MGNREEIFSEISIRERIFSGSIWAFLGKMGSMSFGLIINALLARLLTPTDLGSYFLAISLVSVATVVAQMGLSRTILRLIAEAPGKKNISSIKPALKFVFFYALIGVITVLFFINSRMGRRMLSLFFKEKLPSRVIYLSSVLIFASVFQNILSESFRGFHKIGLASLFKLLLNKLIFACVLVFLWFFLGEISLIRALTLAALAGCINILVAGGFLWQRVSKIGVPGHGKLTGMNVLSIALPIMVTDMILSIFNNGSTWILGFLSSSENVALFNASFRLVSLVVVSLSVINSVLPPIIADLYSKDHIQRLEKVIRSTAFIAGIPAFLGLGLFLVASKPILGLVFGPFYAQGSTILIILILGQLVNVWAGSCQYTLLMTGFQKITMVGNLLSGVLNIILSVFLLDQFGVEGVAAAYSLSIIFNNIFMVFAVKKKIGIWTHIGYPAKAYEVIRKFL